MSKAADMYNLPLLLLVVFSCINCQPRTTAAPPPDMKQLVAEKWSEIDITKTKYFFHEPRIEHLKNEKLRNPARSLILDGLIGLEYLNNGQNEESIRIYKDLLDTREFPDDKLRQIYLQYLGLAYLRKAEQENCIEHHNNQSCILPFQNEGIHHFSDANTKAIETYQKALELDPLDYSSIWLLNLAYMTINKYPGEVPSQYLIPQTIFDPDIDFPRFREIAKEAGVDLLGLSGGTCVEDFNNDGYLDIVASSWGITDQIHYLENRADGTFENKTGSAGLSGIFGGLNTLHADYNNDGFRDFLILRGAWFGEQGKIPNSLIRNNGDGTFEDVTIEAGLLTFAASQTAAWGDIDNDGWLDLFVGNEFTENELFINNGDGTFNNEIHFLDSVVDTRGYIKGCAIGDLTNDGYSELYISYYDRPNRLFLNQSKQNQIRFKDISTTAAVGLPVRSFPTWIWDYDNDGWLDIFVSGYGEANDLESNRQVLASYMGKQTRGSPKLYKNNGDHTFTDMTTSVGLEKVLFTMGSNFGDLDNDGWLDFYLGTGDPDFKSVYPNRMFRNDAGSVFQDITTSGGFGHIQKGHGVAFSDFDNDGDQDIYVVIGGAHIGDVFQNALFENPIGNKNSWITIQLQGTKANRDAIGARVRITTLNEDGETKTYYHHVSTGGSFGSSSLQLEAGLADARSIKELEIIWPNKDHDKVRFKNLEVNQRILIIEGEDQIQKTPVKRFTFGEAKTSS